MLEQFYVKDKQVNYREFIRDYETSQKSVEEEKKTLESEEFKKAIEEISFVIKTERIELKQYFKNWDSFNSNKLKKNKVQQVFSSLRCDIPEQHLKVILEAFEDPIDRTQFNYREFLVFIGEEQSGGRSLGIEPQ